MIYSTRRTIFCDMLANGSHFSCCRQLLLTFLIWTTLFNGGQSLSGECDRLWRSRLNLGLNDGFQLQACCNVSSVTLQPFGDVSKWRLEDDVFTYRFSSTNEFYSDVELFDCNNEAELIPRFLQSNENATCKQLTAQILNIPADGFPLNRWYVVCYEHESGCKACHLDVFCENEYSSSCADVYMQSSISHVSNASMTLWIEMGRNFPFVKDSNIQITVRSQATNAVVGRYQKTPQSSKKVQLNMTGLEPDEWYLVSTCVVISPPSRFLDNYGITLSSSQKKMLCREGSYRTMSTKAGVTLTASFATFVAAIVLLIVS
ncbi:hypothetical protein QR680_001508 [Steinernema hermaphroditum]|uniref:Fibronectin type-III domain-containing protein n=1 Tax=Steinernema hermaphroditum TaxID=289476 RepID=A0AA39GZG4_9BILA|nr:hypothetical protein QR680_001508 [Steinernema hermaphroditum]